MTPHCWADPADRVVIGPEIIADTTAKIKLIQQRIKTANDRQTKYANLRRRDLSFEVGDKVLLKVSPMKGVSRFGQRGKLAPRFIGPYEVLEKVGKVAYRLALPPNLSQVHNVFHVSLLRKCTVEPGQVVNPSVIPIQEDLTYEEKPVQILDRQVKKLRTKWIPMVKILWSNHSEEEATWETEQDMLKRYPSVFPELQRNLGDQIPEGGENVMTLLEEGKEF